MQLLNFYFYLNRQTKFKTTNPDPGIPDLDTLHVVPMKTIGFHACMKDVPFRKQGKLKIAAPDASKDYVGYWWDKKDQKQKWNEKVNEEDEYYYYLHPKYHDD